MYEVLGLTKDASMDEVKKAYKKLALLHHPDKGGNVEEFRKITEAYDKIVNPVGSPPSFLINQQQVHLTLAEVIMGGTKTIGINRLTPCEKCKSTCSHCEGKGRVCQQIMMFTMQQTCHVCLGSGSLYSGCSSCDFKNFTETCDIVNLNIAPGTQEYKLQNGNIILIIKIDTHPDFVRTGPTQVLWCPKISFDDSVKGSKLGCPFFNGDFEVDTSLLVPIDPRIEYQSSNVHVKIKFDIQYPNK